MKLLQFKKKKTKLRQNNKDRNLIEIFHINNDTLPNPIFTCGIFFKN